MPAGQFIGLIPDWELTFFCYQGVGNAGLDLGLVHAGHGVGTVHIEGPVHAVGVIVQGLAVYGLDIRMVTAIFLPSDPVTSRGKLVLPWP